MTNIVANIVVQDKIADGIETKLERIARLSVEAAKGISALNNAVSGLKVGNLTQITAELNKLRGLKLPSVGKISLGGVEGVGSTSSAITEAAQKTDVLAKAQAKLQQENIRLARSADVQQRKFEKQIATMQQQVNVADRGIPVMRAFVATLTANELYQATEAYNRLTNRLTLVTKTAEEARGRFSSLAAVARASYSDIGGVVTLYTRLDLAMKQVGGTSQDAVLVTQSLSKAMSLAGLTAGEANSAMLQISQAFNKGKLDGDEFRSVMENMPLVMDAIARKMGVTRGELLKLAPEGKITAEVMKDAILEAADSIDEAFNKITPTVGQMFENLKTSAIEYFGQLNKEIGVTNLLGNAFKLLAENIDVVTVALGIMAVSFTAATAVKGVSSAIVAFNSLRGAVKSATVETTAAGAAAGVATSRFAALNVALSANPIFAWGTLIATVGTALIGLIEMFTDIEVFGTFDQDMQKANDYVNRIEDIRERKEKASKVELIKESDSAVNAYTTLIEHLNKTKTAYGEARAESEKWANIAAQGVKKVSDASAQYLGVFGQVSDVQQEAANSANTLSSAQSALEQAYVDIVAARESEIETLKEATERLQGQIEATEKQIEMTKAAGAPIDNLEARLNSLKAEYETITNRINTATAALAGFLSLASGVANFSIGQLVTNNKNEKQHNEDVLKTQKVLKEVEDSRYKTQLKQMTASQRDAEFKAKAAAIAKETAASAANVGTKQDKVNEIYNFTEAKEYQKLVEQYNQMNAKKPKGGGGKGRSKKDELNEEAKALKEATKDWKAYNENLKSEQELLNQGFDVYTKYKSLYEEVNKARVAGLEIGDDEISQLKQLIELNERRKKVMSYAEDFKQNTYAERGQDFDMRREAMQTANLSEEDKPTATNSMLEQLGLDTTGTKSYYEQMVNDARYAYEQIGKLQNDNLIDAQESFAMRAQIWAKTQEGMVQPVANMLSNVAQLQNSENKRIARIGKAAAIAQAIMNTYTGATAAYASAAAIPYVGWAMAPIAAGLAVVAGMANVANIRSQGTGYFSGGFTGSGNPTDFAGWTHKNEFVFDHKSTSDLGVNNLQALRTGAAEIRRKGEDVGSSGSSVNVAIENYGTNKNFDVQQIDEKSVRIIVTDVLQSEGETIVKNYLNSEDGQNKVATISKRNS